MTRNDIGSDRQRCLYKRHVDSQLLQRFYKETILQLFNKETILQTIYKRTIFTLLLQQNFNEQLLLKKITMKNYYETKLDKLYKEYRKTEYSSSRVH